MRIGKTLYCKLAKEKGQSFPFDLFKSRRRMPDLIDLANRGGVRILRLAIVFLIALAGIFA